MFFIEKYQSILSEPENIQNVLSEDSNCNENKPEINKKQYVTKFVICNSILTDAISF